jgi:hypothetical protein
VKSGRSVTSGQVYAKADFPDQLLITGLTFYNTLGGAGNGFNGGPYTIALSSTPKPVNGLDLTNLSNNIGADNTVVFSGLLPVGPIPVGGSQTIVFSTPFTFDPASGLHLLLDVTSPAPIAVSSFFDARFDAGGLFSRAMTPGCCLELSDFGLVTGFVTPTPEPASLALLGGPKYRNAHFCSISEQIGNAMAELSRKSAKNRACRSPAWCRTVETRQSALRLAERHNVLFYLESQPAPIPALTAYATKMGRSLVLARISIRKIDGHPDIRPGAP